MKGKKMTPKTKNPLGKGLSALISEGDEDIISVKQKATTTPSALVADNPNGLSVVMVSLAKLVPGSFQPRGYFDEDKLKELATSIKDNGVLQPILVRPFEKDMFEIIAGERRWRASRQAGLIDIPAIIKDMDDRTALEMALIENIQRQSLTPIEEAEGYRRLIDEFSYTQEKLAENLGKSRTHISNTMRLLSLPNEVKDMVNSGVLTVGHARALIGVDNAVEKAHEIVRNGLSVREAEKFAAGSGKLGGGKKGASVVSAQKIAPQKPGSGVRDEDLIMLERILSEKLGGLRVSVDDNEDGGRVTLYFNNLTELDRILQRIG
jgi:ParB family chromosome partitioning protein